MIRQTEWARNNRERKREINRRSRERHLAKTQEYYRLKAKELRAENPELFRERVRKNYWKNPLSHATRMRQWRQLNPEKVNCYGHKYRKTKSFNGGTFTFGEWFSLCSLYELKCICCGKKFPFRKLSPDHVVPIIKGGLNSIENIQPLCRTCNLRKHSKVIDFRIHEFASLW